MRSEAIRSRNILEWNLAVQPYRAGSWLWWRAGFSSCWRQVRHLQW